MGNAPWPWWWAPPPPPPPPPADDKPTSFTGGKSPNINLMLTGSKNCAGCSVGAGAGTSSSAITLTRNVLPMISANRKVNLPPSNLPATGGSPEHFNGPLDNEWCNGGCWYTPKFPSNTSNGGKTPGTDKSATADPPTVLSNRNEEWKNNGTDYKNHYDAQKREEDQLIRKLKLAVSTIKSNRIWNPSDERTEPLGSYAINYNNHGALTKLFMRPTLPFSINYYGM